MEIIKPDLKKRYFLGSSQKDLASLPADVRGRVGRRSTISTSSGLACVQLKRIITLGPNHKDRSMNEYDVQVHEGSGNVFADLGLPDAEDMLLKSKLVMALRSLIEGRKLSQIAAAKLLGTGQADLSKLLRGQIRGYSVERLMRMLTAFEQDIEITLRPHPNVGETGTITFNPVPASRHTPAVPGR